MKNNLTKDEASYLLMALNDHKYMLCNVKDNGWISAKDRKNCIKTTVNIIKKLNLKLR